MASTATKQGYNSRMKILKWFLAFVVVFVGSALINRACTTAPAQPPAAAQPTAQPVAQTSTPVEPAKLAMPTKPINPKYDGYLTAAMPADEALNRDAWYAYNQQECTDNTLASDKKDLVKVQSARLGNLKSTYKHIIGHNDGDIAAVIRGKKYLDAQLDDPKDTGKLIFMTPCLEKRGNIPKAASDLNIVKSLVKLTSRALIESYDAKYTSDSVSKFIDYADNYKLRVLGAEEALKNIK